jgi:hypothetical protein
MKWQVLVLTAGVLSSLFSSPKALGASEGYLYGVHENITHGVVNIGSCWMELPLQTYRGYVDDTTNIKTPEIRYPLGTVRGLYNGVIHTVGRLGWGAVQLGGCWAANPEDNDDIQMVLDAEYAWNEGEKVYFWRPDAGESASAVGRRVGRGFKNFLGSPAEIVGQTRKSVASDGWLHLPVGLGRGVWYTCSRAVYGAADVVFFLVPGPKENYGVAFPEENPWDAMVSGWCQKCGTLRSTCGCPKPVKPPKAKDMEDPEIEEEILEEGAKAE